MSLKEKIIGECNKCGKTGYIGFEVCECLLKFRACNRLVGNGFKEKLIKTVSDENYVFPKFENGERFIRYYLNNPMEVEEKGLSLYIYSKERGRGKTTLSHYIMYYISSLYSKTENYRREDSLSFGFGRAKDIFDGKHKYQYSKFYVLDDLGNEERHPQWKKDKVMSELQGIIHDRRDEPVSTIITSNYHPGDLSRIYDGVLDSLLEIRPDGNIGGTIFRQVEIGGEEDLRLNSSDGWPEDIL